MVLSSVLFAPPTHLWFVSFMWIDYYYITLIQNKLGKKAVKNLWIPFIIHWISYTSQENFKTHDLIVESPKKKLAGNKRKSIYGRKLKA